MAAPDTSRFKRKAVAFDGNWMLHRNLSSLLSRFNAQVAENWERYLVDMTIGQVARTASLLNVSELVVFFDGRKNFRYDVYPEYKANRRDKQERSLEDGVVDLVGTVHPMEAFPLLSQALIECGYPYTMHDRYEGDDLLASYAKHFEQERPDDLLFLFTRDKDILQALAPNVMRYTPAVGKKGKEVYTTIETMLAAAGKELGKGLTPYQHVVYQILAGDSGDNVPGVVGPAEALCIVKDPTFTTLTEWFKTERGREVARKHRAEVVRNAQMVKLVNTLFTSDVKAHPRLPLPKSILAKSQTTQASRMTFSKNTTAAIQGLNTRLMYAGRGLFSGPPIATTRRTKLSISRA